MRRLVRIVRRLLRLAPAAVCGAAALAALTFTVPATAQPAPIHLERGWNNVAYFGPAAEPASALAAIAGKYSAVWYWDAAAQHYRSYRPGDPGGSDLDRMLPGACYWIVASEPIDITLGSPSAGAVRALTPGWNNLVYTGPERPVEEALGALAGRYTAVYGWDALGQHFSSHLVGAAQPGDLTTLQPYSCYWLRFA